MVYYSKWQFVFGLLSRWQGRGVAWFQCTQFYLCMPSSQGVVNHDNVDAMVHYFSVRPWVILCDLIKQDESYTCISPGLKRVLDIIVKRIHKTFRNWKYPYQDDFWCKVRLNYQHDKTKRYKNNCIQYLDVHSAWLGHVWSSIKYLWKYYRFVHFHWQVSKLVNEVYHMYNRNQFPFVVMDISLAKGN